MILLTPRPAILHPSPILYVHIVAIAIAISYIVLLFSAPTTETKSPVLSQVTASNYGVSWEPYQDYMQYCERTGPSRTLKK